MSIVSVGLISPVIQFEDASGVPIAGGTVAFYATGTTTLQTVYSDAALTVALTNPVPLNAAGRTSTSATGPTTGVYFSSLAYDYTLFDANGVNVYGPFSFSGSQWPGALNGNVTLSPAAGATGYGHQLAETINKASTGTHSLFAGVYLATPTIGAGGSTLTEAATLYIAGAPATGTNKYALHIAAGNALFSGNITGTGTASFSGATSTGALTVTGNATVSGAIGIANTSPGTPLQINTVTKNANGVADSKILGMQSLVSTASASTFVVNGYFYSEQTAATSGSIQNLEGQTFITHTSGTVTLGFAVVGNIDHAGTATTTTMRAVTGGVQMHGTGGGTDAICFDAQLTGQLGGGTATFTNGYALKIEGVGTGFTNVWGIYSAPGSGGNNYFQNHVCLGVTTTTHLFELATDDAVKPTTNTWTIASDARLKRHVVDFNEGLETIRSIRPVSYEMNGVGGFAREGAVGVGVIAQEASAVLSPLLRSVMIGTSTRDGVDYLTWNSGALDYVFINSIKALDARLTSAGL